MDTAKRVAKNTGILYARMAITVFISLYITRIILEALGAEDYGIYHVIWGAVDMLIFLNSAMIVTSQRFMSYALGEKDKQKQKFIFNVSTVLHIIIAFVVILILEIAGYFFFNGILNIPENRIQTAKALYQFVLLTTFFRILTVPFDAVINAHENMTLVAIIGIIEKIIHLIIAIYISNYSFDKLYYFGFLMAFIPLALLIFKIFYCSRKYEEVHFNLKKFFNRPLLKEMINFASLSLLNSSASIVTMQGVSIILNNVFGVIVNAAQGVSNQITGKLMGFSFTMLKALNPVIVKSEGGNNRKKMLRASMTGNKVSFFLFAFLAIPVLIEMPSVMNLWLKDVPEFAVLFCRLSLVRLVLDQLTITFPTSIEATGKIRHYSYWNSATYIVVLPISYFAFKIGFPPYFIFIILLLMTLALSSIRIYYCHKVCGLSLRLYFIDVFLRSLGTALPAFTLALLPIFYMPDGILRGIMVLLISSLSFPVFLFAFGFEANEKAVFKQVLLSFTKKIKLPTVN